MGNKKKKVAPMTKDKPGVEGPRQAPSRTQQKASGAQVALVNPCTREPLVDDPERTSFVFKKKVRVLLFYQKITLLRESRWLFFTL